MEVVDTESRYATWTVTREENLGVPLCAQVGGNIKYFTLWWTQVCKERLDSTMGKEVTHIEVIAYAVTHVNDVHFKKMNLVLMNIVW